MGRRITLIAGTVVAVSLALLGGATSAQADDNTALKYQTDASAGRVEVVGSDGKARVFERDAVNDTGWSGVSATIQRQLGDTLSLSPDQKVATLSASDGEVLLSVSSPSLGSSSRPIGAKFVIDEDKLVVTPVDSVRLPRAGCASSAAGQVIVGIGMAGVCAALAVGTVVGGVICTAAVIGGGAGINWDSSCKK